MQWKLHLSAGHLAWKQTLPYFTSNIYVTETPEAAADASLLIKVLRDKLVLNKNEVEVQRNDPNSPLHSVKSFDELPLYVCLGVIA